MKLLRTYLRRRLALLAALGVSFGIFLLTFWLYRLPLAAVFYPACLCLVLFVLLGIWDYSRFAAKQHRLEQITAAPTELTADLLSQEADGEYSRILTKVLRDHAQSEQRQEHRYQDTVDYFTVWAHQIKTPIAAMKLNVQEEDSPAARRISADLQRTEQYVDMAMTYLRLESNSTDYVIRSCDLDRIIRSALRKFAGEFVLRRLRLEYDGVNAQVLTDEKWLCFVVEQVISNALKYTPTGSISITLEPEQVLCIRDTGIGIAPEDLPRIFERGFTGCNGRTDLQASGIGLYLCKRICTRLGHTITASSVPEQGTEIRINLAHRDLEIE